MNPLSLLGLNLMLVGIGLWLILVTALSYQDKSIVRPNVFNSLFIVAIALFFWGSFLMLRGECIEFLCGLWG